MHRQANVYRRRGTDKACGYQLYDIMVRTLVPSFSLFFLWMSIVHPDAFRIDFKLEVELVELALWMSSAVCALLLGDVIINDVMPRKFYLRTLKAFREMLWMSAGLMQVVYSTLLMRDHETSSMGVIFLIQGGAAISVAFLEVYKKRANR